VDLKSALLGLFTEFSTNPQGEIQNTGLFCGKRNTNYQQFQICTSLAVDNGTSTNKQLFLFIES
jgi:hypothetical protein